MNSNILTVRKKPVVVQAMQYTGDNIADLREWADVTWSDTYGAWAVVTLEGEMKLEPGCYVICGLQGEFYPCRQDIFEASYEPADSLSSFGVKPD
jgi:hypothetical protein